MYSIAFIDTEVDPESKKILDIGGLRSDNGMQYHGASGGEFIEFLKGVRFVCGHNMLHHDAKYIGNALSKAGIAAWNYIDTLYMSPLLFPMKLYHALLKDDKLQSNEMNNPLNDSIKARDLFYDEVRAFQELDKDMKDIFCTLLSGRDEFQAFFRFIDYTLEQEVDKEALIRSRFEGGI